MSYLNQKLQRAMRGGDVGGMQEVASQASRFGSRDIMRQAERGLRDYNKAQERAQKELVRAQRDAQRQADRQAREAERAARQQASDYKGDAIAFFTEGTGANRTVIPIKAPSGGVFKKWGKSGVLWDSITGLPYAMDAKSRAVTQIDPDKDGKLVSKDGHMYKVVEGLPWKHVGFDPAKVGNDPALAKELAAKTADAKREADQASDKAAATRKLIADNEKGIRALEKDQLNANSDDHKRIQGEIDQLKGKNKGLRERIELEQIDAHKKAAYRQEVESANDKRLADDLASRQKMAYQGDPKGGLGLQSALNRISQAQQSSSSYNTDPVAALMGSIADRGLAAAGRLESDNLKIADSITNAWNSNQKARTDAKIDAWGRNKSIEQTNALLSKMDASGTYKLTGTNEKGKPTGLLHDPDASPELKARIQNFVNKTGVTEIPRSWMTPEAQEARANANQFGLYDVKLPQNFVLSKGAISTTRDEQSDLWGIPMPWNTKGKPVDVGTYQFDRNGVPFIELNKDNRLSPSQLSGDPLNGVKEYLPMPSDWSEQFKPRKPSDFSLSMLSPDQRREVNDNYKNELATYEQTAKDAWAGQKMDAERFNDTLTRWTVATPAQRQEMIAELDPRQKGIPASERRLDTRAMFEAGVISAQEGRLLERAFYGTDPTMPSMTEAFEDWKKTTPAGKEFTEKYNAIAPDKSAGLFSFLPLPGGISKLIGAVGEADALARKTAFEADAKQQFLTDFYKDNSRRVDFSDPAFTASRNDILKDVPLFEWANKGLFDIYNSTAGSAVGILGGAGAITGDWLYNKVTGGNLLSDQAKQLIGSQTMGALRNMSAAVSDRIEPFIKTGALLSPGTAMNSLAMGALDPNAPKDLWTGKTAGQLNRAWDSYISDIDNGTLTQAKAKEHEAKIGKLTEQFSSLRATASGWMESVGLEDGAGYRMSYENSLNDPRSAMAQFSAAYQQTRDPRLAAQARSSSFSSQSELEIQRAASDYATANGTINESTPFGGFASSIRGGFVAPLTEYGIEIATNLAGFASGGVLFGAKALGTATRVGSTLNRAAGAISTFEKLGDATADAFRNLGKIDRAPGTALTAGQRAWNTSVDMAKQVGVSGGGEFFQEAVAAFGEAGASFGDAINQGMSGFIGGVGMSAVHAVGGVGLSAVQQIRSEQAQTKALTKFVADYNKQNNTGTQLTLDVARQAQNYQSPQMVAMLNGQRKDLIIQLADINNAIRATPNPRIAPGELAYTPNPKRVELLKEKARIENALASNILDTSAIGEQSVAAAREINALPPGQREVVDAALRAANGVPLSVDQETTLTNHTTASGKPAVTKFGDDIVLTDEFREEIKQVAPETAKAPVLRKTQAERDAELRAKYGGVYRMINGRSVFIADKKPADAATPVQPATPPTPATPPLRIDTSNMVPPGSSAPTGNLQVSPSLRLNELQSKAEGTPERQITLPDGRQSTSPARPPQPLTPAEQQEFTQLQAQLQTPAPTPATGPQVPAPIPVTPPVTQNFQTPDGAQVSGTFEKQPDGNWQQTSPEAPIFTVTPDNTQFFQTLEDKAAYALNPQAPAPVLPGEFGQEGYTAIDPAPQGEAPAAPTPTSPAPVTTTPSAQAETTAEATPPPLPEPDVFSQPVNRGTALLMLQTAAPWVSGAPIVVRSQRFFQTEDGRVVDASTYATLSKSERSEFSPVGGAMFVHQGKVHIDETGLVEYLANTTPEARQEKLKAALREELIHVATLEVRDRKQLSKDWNALPAEAKRRVIETYYTEDLRQAGGDWTKVKVPGWQAAAEFWRMYMNSVTEGRTTEQVDIASEVASLAESDPSFAQRIKEALQDIARWLREELLGQLDPDTRADFEQVAAKIDAKLADIDAKLGITPQPATPASEAASPMATAVPQANAPPVSATQGVSYSATEGARLGYKNFQYRALDANGNLFDAEIWAVDSDTAFNHLQSRDDIQFRDLREIKARTKPTNSASSNLTSQEQAEIDAAISGWDRSNRNRQGSEWMDGAYSPEAQSGFSDAAQNGAANLQSHGMGKAGTLTGGLQSLLDILANGIDPNRGRGGLDTAQLALNKGQVGAQGATASGTSYRDGPFIIVQNAEGSKIGAGITDASQIAAVLVNEANIGQLEAIQKAIQSIRPDIIVAPYSQAGTVAAQLTAPQSTGATNTSSATPAETIDTPAAPLTRLPEKPAPRNQAFIPKPAVGAKKWTDAAITNLLSSAGAAFGYKVVKTDLDLGIRDNWGNMVTFGTQLYDKTKEGSDVGQWIDAMNPEVNPVGNEIIKNASSIGLHRVWYGHDFAANVGDVVDKFGWIGVPKLLGALLSDSTTTSGIPLPGTQFLVHAGVVGDKAATEWLSINVGEVLGLSAGFLGTYMLHRAAKSGRLSKPRVIFATIGISIKLISGVMTAQPFLILSGLADTAILVTNLDQVKAAFKKGIQEFNKKPQAVRDLFERVAPPTAVAPVSQESSTPQDGREVKLPGSYPGDAGSTPAPATTLPVQPVQSVEATPPPLPPEDVVTPEQEVVTDEATPPPLPPEPVEQAAAPVERFLAEAKPMLDAFVKDFDNRKIGDKEAKQFIATLRATAERMGVPPGEATFQNLLLNLAEPVSLPLTEKQKGLINEVQKRFAGRRMRIQPEDLHVLKRPVGPNGYSQSMFADSAGKSPLSWAQMIQLGAIRATPDGDGFFLEEASATGATAPAQQAPVAPTIKMAQAAKTLGITPKELLRLVKAAVIPAQKSGNNYLFTQEALDTYTAERAAKQAPILEKLAAVAGNTASEADIADLRQRGLVEIYRGQQVINPKGYDLMAKAGIAPRLTRNQRVQEIDDQLGPVQVDDGSEIPLNPRVTRQGRLYIVQGPLGSTPAQIPITNERQAREQANATAEQFDAREAELAALQQEQEQQAEPEAMDLQPSETDAPLVPQFYNLLISALRDYNSLRERGDATPESAERLVTQALAIAQRLGMENLHPGTLFLRLGRLPLGPLTRSQATLIDAVHDIMQDGMRDIAPADLNLKSGIASPAGFTNRDSSPLSWGQLIQLGALRANPRPDGSLRVRMGDTPEQIKADAEKSELEAMQQEYLDDLRGDIEDIGGLEGAGVGRELLSAIESFGGIPDPDGQNASNFRGELKTLKEDAQAAARTIKTAVKGTYSSAPITVSRIFRKDAPDLDSVAEMLRGHGFDTFGPDDVVNLLQQRFTKKSPMYGTTAIFDDGMGDRAVAAKPRVQLANASVTTEAGPIFLKKAHHGTPHKVDRFSLEKIGSGEGAQAYGWGLYFAEQQKVAEEYRETLGGEHRLDGEIFIKGGMFGPAARRIYNTLGKEAGDILVAFIGRGKERVLEELKNPYDSIDQATRDRVLDLLDRIESTNPGNTYTVELDVDDADLLDWDKPLSEQSEKVQAALAEMNSDYSPESEEYDANEMGQMVYTRLGNAKPASEKLLAAGISGIRYLDGGSRGRTTWQAIHPRGGINEFPDEQQARSFVARNPEFTLEAPEQTYNFVIFDENLIRIVAENGEPVGNAEVVKNLMAETPAAGMLQEDGIPGALPLDTAGGLAESGTRPGAQPAQGAAPARAVDARQGELGIPAEAAFAGIAYRPARIWGLQALADRILRLRDRVSGQPIQAPIFRRDFGARQAAFLEAAQTAESLYRDTLANVDATYADRPGTADYLLPRLPEVRALFTDANGEVQLLGTRPVELDAGEPLFAKPRRIAPHQLDLFSDNYNQTAAPWTPSWQAKEPAKAEADAPALSLEAQTESSGRIEDFGEKLQGARKDLWQRYTDMVMAELPADARDITLAKYLPEPDYEAMIASGMEPARVAAVKALRDVIPRKPSSGYKLAIWTKMVRDLRPLIQRLIDPANPIPLDKFQLAIADSREIRDTVRFYEDLGWPHFMQAKGWKLRQSQGYIRWNGELVPKGTIVTHMEQDYRASTALSSVNPDGDWKQGYAAVLEKFRDYLDAEAAQAKEPKKIDFQIYSDTQTRDVFIGKKGASGVVRLQTGFASAKEANNWLTDHYNDLALKWEGMRQEPVLRRATNEPRTGPKRREGDVTPEMFSEAFGFRGVQFGNYVEGERRQRDLNNAFDAFMDLSDALGVPTKALSFDGSLGLAFGARGRGGKRPAAAHYEPGEVVINLTKNAGPGSLAHEWFHALDNYFARLERTASTAPKAIDEWATRNINDPRNVRPEVMEAFRAIRNSLGGDLDKRSRAMDSTRSAPYYSQTIEKAARAFETYVIDRLGKSSVTNDYLANIDPTSEAYPRPNEMDGGIRQAFDTLFTTLDTRQGERGTMLFAKPRRQLTEDSQPLFAKARKPRPSSLLAETKGKVVAGTAVGTRNPTGKAAQEAGTDRSALVDLASMRRDPELFRKNAVLLADFPLVAGQVPEAAKIVRDISAPLKQAREQFLDASKRLEDARNELKAELARRQGVRPNKIKVAEVDKLESGESKVKRTDAVVKAALQKIKDARKIQDAFRDKRDKRQAEFEANSKALLAGDQFPMALADRVYAALKTAAVRNLELLIELFPADLRDTARLWYDGANIIAQDFAARYNTTLNRSSAVLAVFSPQKDWFMNVALGQRMMNIWANHQNTRFDDAMAKQYLMRAGEPEPQWDKKTDDYKRDAKGDLVYTKGAKPIRDEEGNITGWENWDNEKAQEKFDKAQKDLAVMRGKKLTELEPHEQARFIRMWSEVYDAPSFPVVTPAGTFGNNKLSEKGNEQRLAWGSYVTIEKAIAILTAPADSEMQVISNELGVQHKVRSFYNNIVDPANPDKHVTMDTHAIAAILWQALSGNSPEVSMNFGGGGASGNSNLGVSGLYAAFAEAYREVAADFGLLPREVQSITWESVRLLFPAKFKSQKANVAKVREVWDQHEQGTITTQQAHDRIFQIVDEWKRRSSLAGQPGRTASDAIADGSGVGRPDWAEVTRSGADNSANTQGTADAGGLPDGGRRGDGTGRPVVGRRGAGRDARLLPATPKGKQSGAVLGAKPRPSLTSGQASATTSRMPEDQRTAETSGQPSRGVPARRNYVENYGPVFRGQLSAYDPKQLAKGAIHFSELESYARQYQQSGFRNVPDEGSALIKSYLRGNLLDLRNVTSLEDAKKRFKQAGIPLSIKYKYDPLSQVKESAEAVSTIEETLVEIDKAYNGDWSKWNPNMDLTDSLIIDGQWSKYADLMAFNEHGNLGDISWVASKPENISLDKPHPNSPAPSTGAVLAAKPRRTPPPLPPMEKRIEASLDAIESWNNVLRAAEERPAGSVRKLATEIRETMPYGLWKGYQEFFRGRLDYADTLAPGVKAILQAAQQEESLAQIGVNAVVDGLRRELQKSFGDPAFWSKNRKRLKEATRVLLPIASYLQPESVGVDGGFVWREFERRSGTISQVEARKLRLKDGQWFQYDGRTYRLGDFLPDEKAFVLLEPVSVEMQQAIYEEFWQNFPEALPVLDRWITPDLKDAFVVGMGGQMSIEFNREALFNFMNDWPQDLKDAFGDLLPEVPRVEGYTPDVALRPDVAAQKAQASIIASILGKYKSPGRKFKSGALREAGNVKNLIDGFSIRAMEAQREKIRMRMREGIIEKAVVLRDDVPAENIGDYVALEDVFSNIVKAVEAARLLDKKSYPHLSRGLNPKDQVQLMKLVGDASRLNGIEQMVHKDIHRELMLSMARAQTDGIILRIMNFFLRGVKLGVLTAGSVGMNQIGVELAKLTQLLNRVFYSFTSLLVGETRGAKVNALEAMFLLRGLITDRMPNTLNQSRIADLIPRELFENTTLLSSLDAGANYGNIVDDMKRNGVFRGSTQGLVNAFTQGGISASILYGVNYGGVDSGGKQQSAYAAYRARAEVAADEAGIKKNRTEWMRKWINKQVRENTDIHREVMDATKLFLLDYENVPNWMNPSASLPNEKARRFLKEHAMWFVKYPYNFIRLMKRMGLDGAIETFAPSSTKAERARGLANMLTIAAIAYGGTALLSGDDEEDSVTGSRYDEDGNFLDRDQDTSSRLNISAIARNLRLGRVIGTALRMAGVSVNDDLTNHRGDDFWMYYRNITWLPEALLMGRVVKGDFKGFLHDVGPYISDMMSTGILVRMLGLVTVGSMDAKKKTENLYAETAWDVLSSPINPGALTRYISYIADPASRRSMDSSRMDFKFGPLEAVKAKIPGLTKTLPAAGKVDLPALLTSNYNSGADYNARLKAINKNLSGAERDAAIRDLDTRFREQAASGPIDLRQVMFQMGIDPAKAQSPGQTTRNIASDLSRLQQMGVGAESVRITEKRLKDGRVNTYIAYPDPDTVAYRDPMFSLIKIATGVNIRPLPRRQSRPTPLPETLTPDFMFGGDEQQANLTLPRQ